MQSCSSATVISSGALLKSATVLAAVSEVSSVLSASFAHVSFAQADSSFAAAVSCAARSCAVSLVTASLISAFLVSDVSAEADVSVSDVA